MGELLKPDFRISDAFTSIISLRKKKSPMKFYYDIGEYADVSGLRFKNKRNMVDTKHAKRRADS